MTKKQSWIRSDKTARLVFCVVCLSLTLIGVNASLGGDRSYENYYGGLVFGPLAAVVGAIGLALGLFWWKRLDAASKRKKKKLKGRAARKARQAERYRSPVEDFDKPWTGSR